MRLKCSWRMCQERRLWALAHAHRMLLQWQNDESLITNNLTQQEQACPYDDYSLLQMLPAGMALWTPQRMGQMTTDCEATILIRRWYQRERCRSLHRSHTWEKRGTECTRIWASMPALMRTGSRPGMLDTVIVRMSWLWGRLDSVKTHRSGLPADHNAALELNCTSKLLLYWSVGLYAVTHPFHSYFAGQERPQEWPFQDAVMYLRDWIAGSTNSSMHLMELCRDGLQKETSKERTHPFALSQIWRLQAGCPRRTQTRRCRLERLQAWAHRLHACGSWPGACLVWHPRTALPPRRPRSPSCHLAAPAPPTHTAPLQSRRLCVTPCCKYPRRALEGLLACEEAWRAPKPEMLHRGCWILSTVHLLCWSPITWLRWWDAGKALIFILLFGALAQKKRQLLREAHFIYCPHLPGSRSFAAQQRGWCPHVLYQRHQHNTCADPDVSWSVKRVQMGLKTSLDSPGCYWFGTGMMRGTRDRQRTDVDAHEFSAGGKLPHMHGADRGAHKHRLAAGVPGHWQQPAAQCWHWPVVCEPRRQPLRCEYAQHAVIACNRHSRCITCSDWQTVSVETPTIHSKALHHRTELHSQIGIRYSDS